MTSTRSTIACPILACKSRVTAIGTSRPTRSRTRRTISASASGNPSATIAPCSVSTMPSAGNAAAMCSHSSPARISKVWRSGTPVETPSAKNAGASSMPRSRQASITPPSEWLRPAKASSSSPRATTLRLSTVVGSTEKVCVSCMMPPVIRRMARALRRGRSRADSSSPQVARHRFDDGEGFRKVHVGMRQGETRVSGRTLPGVAVEVDATVEAAGGKAAIELVVVVERVRPGPHGIGDTEVDAEAGSHTLHARGDSRPLENGLQVAVEGVGRGVDAVIDTGLTQLLQGGEGSQHAEEMSGVRPAVGHRPGGGEIEHQVFPAGDRGQRQSIGQRLGVCRQIRGDSVLGLHAAEVGAETGEHLVHDKDDPVLPTACSEELQEPRLGWNAAGVVVNRLAEDGRELLTVGGDRALERLAFVPGNHYHVVRTRNRHPSGRGYDRTVVVERVGATVEPGLSETVEMTVEFQVLGAAGGVAGDAQRNEGHLD